MPIKPFERLWARGLEGNEWTLKSVVDHFNFLVNHITFFFQRFDFVLHFVQKAVSRRFGHGKEADVVFRSLDFAGQAVELTKQAFAFVQNLALALVFQIVLESVQPAAALVDVQAIHHFVHCIVPSLVNLILFLERHVTDGIPLGGQLADQLRNIFLKRFLCDGFHLFNEFLFGGQVLLLFVFLRRSILFLLFEEMVAGSDETFPNASGNFFGTGPMDFHSF